MHTVIIDIEIPDELMQMGAIEMFAKSFGWTPTVQDESGEIENPVTAEEFGKAQIRQFVLKRVKREAGALAAKQAEETINSVVGI